MRWWDDEMCDLCDSCDSTKMLPKKVLQPQAVRSLQPPSQASQLSFTISLKKQHERIEMTWNEMKWIFFQHENTKRSQRGHEEIESSATKPWLCHLTRLGTTKKTRGSTRQKDKIQSSTKSKYIVFLVKKEMKAILFQMPIMPIMTFAPSYWCIRSANPFGRQKCPGSQLLHLEALGQEIGSQVSKIWGSMRIKGDSQKNSKNSKDQRSPSPWRPGSSSRKLCRWRKANNSSAARWKRTVTPVSPSTRPTDLRLSTAPRAARCNSLSRHIEHLFHWKHLHRCTVTMPNLLYHAVPSYHVWLHHFFTGSHYIHIYSHMITYDHMNEKRFGSMASVKYVPAPHSKAPHTSIYILYKYGPYLAWVAKSSASDDGVPES